MLVKQDFCLDPSIRFLNHGSFGACTKDVLEEQRRWQQRMEQQPVLFFRQLPQLMLEPRLALAQHFKCDHNDIVWVPNATYAANAVLRALCKGLAAEHSILTTNQEYGACARALRFYANERSIAVRTVEIPLPAPSQDELSDMIIAQCDATTQILFLSHITSPTSIKLPVETICRAAKERGIVTIVDGAHAPGMLDVALDQRHFDVYFGNCHKWMCTPKGSAFLWVAPGLQSSIEPLVISWGWQSEQPTGSCLIDWFEFAGTQDPSAFLSIPYALQVLQTNDWHAMRHQSRLLVDRATRAMENMGCTPLTGGHEYSDVLLQSVWLPEHTSPTWLKEELYNRDIEVVVQWWQNKPLLRVSAFAHTSPEDIDVFIDELRSVLRP
jgi:isopenicillin-N epimerase